MYITKTVNDFVKSKEKFSDVYFNKQSVFTDWIRKETFLLKTKHTKSRSKDTLLYIPINLSKIICKAYADYVIGGGLDVEWLEDWFFEELDEKTNISKKLFDSIVKTSYIWYSILRIRHTSDKGTVNMEDIKIDKIPVRNYYPSFDWLNIWEGIEWIKKHRIISEVSEEIDNESKLFIYCDTYEKEDNKWKYTREKYKTESWHRNEWENWHWWSFSDGELILEDTLEYLPLFIFNNEETNNEDEESIWNDIFWISDLADIMELLQEYNDRYSQVSVEFIKHLNSSMSIPHSLKSNVNRNKKRAIQREKEGLEAEEDTGFKIDWVDKVFTHQAQEQPAHYLSKELQTDKALERLEKVIRDIAWIKNIPMGFFNTKNDWQQETTATSIVYGRDRFNKAIETKQRTIKQQIQLMLAYINFLTTWQYIIPTIEFNDPTPQDNNSKADYYIKLKNAGVVDEEEIMRKVLKRNEDKIKEQLEKNIDKQKIEAEISWVNTNFNNLNQLQ